MEINEIVEGNAETIFKYINRFEKLFYSGFTVSNKTS